MSEKNQSKEEVIINAARKRFAHYGFTKVTMDEIADDIGMGKASLYYYFPTKEKLFREVVNQEMNEFSDEIEAIINSSVKPTKKLETYANKRLEYFEKLVNLGTLNVHSIKDGKFIYRDLFQSLEVREIEFLDNIINEGIKQKIFKKSVCKDISPVIIHLFHGLRLRTVKGADNFTITKALWEELRHENKVVVKIILEGLLAK